MTQNEVIVGRPNRPLAIRAINGFGRTANALGMRPVSLEVEVLLRKAANLAKSDDFGDEGFLEGLERLVASLEEDAELTLLGRLVAQRTLVDNLANRLRLVAWRNGHPEVAEEDLGEPLFIVGLPRTGTTILHALLAEDRAHRAPLFWEVQFPVPPATTPTWHTDPRIDEDHRVLEQLYRLVPELRAIHPMGATMPQECVAVFSMCFMSEQYSVQFRVPSYQNWLDDQDMHATYEFHRRYLQHAQSGGVRGERWVLKSPAHLHLLETLFDVFPKARVIHTHRNPVEVCVSAASLTMALRGVASDALDPVAIGREQVDWWAKLLERCVAQRKSLSTLDERFFDLHMGELVRDPVGAVKRIYAHFGYRFGPKLESTMQRFMEDNRRDKHGSHTYRAADFGIDPSMDGQRFADYIDYFGLDTEKT